MNSLVAFTVLIGLFAVGDLISARTKGYISSMFATLVIAVAITWAGIIKPTIVADAGLMGISVIAVTLLLVNIGTLVDLKVIKKEWKTVLISLGAFIGLTIGILTIGRLFLDSNEAFVSIPMLYGGTVSGIMFSQHAAAIGLPAIGVFAVLINVTQGMVGMPILSIALRKEVNNLQAEGALRELAIASDAEMVYKENKSINFPKSFFTPYMGIFIVTILGLLANWIGQYTQAYFLHPYTLCIIFGVLASLTGITKKNALGEANAGVFVTYLALLIIFHILLTGLTPATLKELAVPLFSAYIVGVPFLIVGGILVGKIFKMRSTLSIPIALASMCGVLLGPIVLEEVLRNVELDKDIKVMIRGFILPKLIIGGIISMNLLSIVFASIFIKFVA